MQYSIIGFPRIGLNRELKWATEKYFRNEIDGHALTNTAAVLRAGQWKVQQAAGNAFIPSNDYSLYDGMLDTAYMLSAIPERYEELHFDDMEPISLWQEDIRDVSATSGLVQ